MSARTSLATVRAAPPAQARQQEIDVAGMMRAITAPFNELKPYGRVKALTVKHATAFSEMHFGRDRWRDREVTRNAALFLTILPQFPEPKVIEASEQRLRTALTTAAEPAQISVFGAIINDAWRLKSGDDVLTYSDMLTLALEDLPILEFEEYRTFPRIMPVSALAKSIITLCQTHKAFRPSIAEVIEAAREERRKLWNAWRYVEDLPNKVEHMRDIIIQAEIIAEAEVAEATPQAKPKDDFPGSDIEDDIPF